MKTKFIAKVIEAPIFESPVRAKMRVRDTKAQEINIYFENREDIVVCEVFKIRYGMSLKLVCEITLNDNIATFNCKRVYFNEYEPTRVKYQGKEEMG